MDHARHALIVVCLGLLAATAGCGFLAGGRAESPTASPAVDATDTAETPATGDSAPGSPEPTATATPTAGDGEIVPVDGNLSVNATRVFERVERLHGVEADAPTVVVGTGEPREAGTYDSPFYRAVGITGRIYAAGQLVGPEEVFVDANVSDPERTLAHEFAHTVHSQERWLPTGLRSVSDDELRAAWAVIEGSAVYTTDEYLRTHAEDARLGSRTLRRSYDDGNPAYRLFVSRYVAGVEYVEARADSPSELEPVLTDPPETTEAILHPDRNVSVGYLAVSTAPGNWSVEPGHYPSGADRRGELFVRELLRLELDRAVADSAANGWDNDRSLAFVDPGSNETAVAWTLRFENATEADEFAAAFERFADRRAANSSLTFASERVAPETLTVFAGNETFVDGAVATGSNESVHIAVPSANGTASTQGVRPPAAD
ncbi:hypothetical protein [Halosimplex marinum]|uniref:hypothetical protein n=1 Tax=Halosimplex marinum TaxID=3396620 RepID=UPI003F54754B